MQLISESIRKLKIKCRKRNICLQWRTRANVPGGWWSGRVPPHALLSPDTPLDWGCLGVPVAQGCVYRHICPKPSVSQRRVTAGWSSDQEETLCLSVRGDISGWFGGVSCKVWLCGSESFLSQPHFPPWFLISSAFIKSWRGKGSGWSGCHGRGSESKSLWFKLIHDAVVKSWEWKLLV